MPNPPHHPAVAHALMRAASRLISTPLVSIFKGVVPS